jgi:hypothetical protein
LPGFVGLQVQVHPPIQQAKTAHEKFARNDDNDDQNQTGIARGEQE